MMEKRLLSHEWMQDIIHVYCQACYKAANFFLFFFFYRDIWLVSQKAECFFFSMYICAYITRAPLCVILKAIAHLSFNWDNFRQIALFLFFYCSFWIVTIQMKEWTFRSLKEPCVRERAVNLAWRKSCLWLAFISVQDRFAITWFFFSVIKYLFRYRFIFFARF